MIRPQGPIRVKWEREPAGDTSAHKPGVMATDDNGNASRVYVARASEQERKHVLDEAIEESKTRIASNIRWTVFWLALLIGMVTLYVYFPPEQMAKWIQGIVRDLRDYFGGVK